MEQVFHLRKNNLANTYKVLKYIEENPDTYLRDISRNLNLSPSIVYRILKKTSIFLETKSVGITHMPILIKLKQGATAEGIIKFLKIKEKLNG
jgi:hypothetical protein